METIILTAGVAMVFILAGTLIGCVAGFSFGYCVGSQRSLCVHVNEYYPGGGDDDDDGGDFIPQGPSDPEMARWGTTQN